jgi:hypothetical protein
MLAIIGTKCALKLKKDLAQSGICQLTIKLPGAIAEYLFMPLEINLKLDSKKEFFFQALARSAGPYSYSSELDFGIQVLHSVVHEDHALGLQVLYSAQACYDVHHKAQPSA